MTKIHSCTGFFAFALATGVRNGWLTEPRYAAAARKAWLALANKTNAAGKIDAVALRVSRLTAARPRRTLWHEPRRRHWSGGVAGRRGRGLLVAPGASTSARVPGDGASARGSAPRTATAAGTGDS